MDVKLTILGYAHCSSLQYCLKMWRQNRLTRKNHPVSVTFSGGNIHKWPLQVMDETYQIFLSLILNNKVVFFQAQK